MKPSEKYQLLMDQPGFVVDSAQQHSIALLDHLFARIVHAEPANWWRSLLSDERRWPKITGLYFWGGVGRGKTFLMDIFYQSLPKHIKSERTHFHSFMNRIQVSLQQQLDIENPLQRVAQDIAAETQVLCLDEFVIIDIGDAMIMAGLLEALFHQGVVLVTTSNTAPKNLYHDGLQRARFLPAIDQIGRHCEIVNLDGQQDYRLRFLQQTDLYSVPHSDETGARIRDYLAQHVAPIQAEQHQLTINGRELAYQYCAEDTVWFSFSELCESARSQNDYLELARFFNTLILTDIHQMNHSDDDVARRFVLLIDVLYDHGVKLICSAAVSPDQLYLGKRLSFEFERTASRLIEMQSEQYLSQAHSLQ
ncbi:MAG: cell division protein ZapE [Gammaproteobacteria bacterium]|nr:cell division protein ZapE [Gammaproteobacteria bacterium]